MSLPPVAIAVVVIDLCAWLLLLPALATALRVVAGWDPPSAEQAQLRLERRAEQGSLLGRLAVALFCLSSLVLLVGLLVTLPRVVPGAMCAAGVLEALPAGRVMVALRIAAMVAAVVWTQLDSLNRHAPLAPLVPGAARGLLVFGAIAAVASWRTWHALGGLDLERTVSCCTILYDLAGVSPADGSGARLGAATAAVGLTACAVGVATLSLVLARRAGRRSRTLPAGAPPDRPVLLLLLVTLTAAWAALGALALVDWSGPHLFGTLGHRCPWCLFLPSHGGYGWWAFGLIALGVRAALTMVTSDGAARVAPELRVRVDRGLVRSGVLLALIALVLVGLAAAPVLWWRASTGVDLLASRGRPVGAGTAPTEV